MHYNASASDFRSVALIRMLASWYTTVFLSVSDFNHFCFMVLSNSSATLKCSSLLHKWLTRIGLAKKIGSTTVLEYMMACKTDYLCGCPGGHFRMSQ